MQCRKCKAEIADDSVYCPYCGTKQAKEKRKALKRANGTGTVYKLQGRRKRPWVAAKGKVILGYYETKTAALEMLGRATDMIISDRYNYTFEQVFNEWKVIHYKGVTQNAADIYDKSFKVFSSLHKRRFRDLRTSDFQKIIDSERDDGKSYSILAKRKQLITQLSTWAVREEIITTNFATYVKLPKEEKKEKEIFSDEDIKVLESDGSEAAKVVLMLIYTGMRIGELFNLPLSDYHGNYVIGGEKTDAGRNRVIPINPEGRDYFAFFAAKASGNLLISGYSGGQTSRQFRMNDYYPLLKRLGIKRITPHSTRHTYECLLLGTL